MIRLLPLALVLSGCYRVTVVWPSEPLKVIVVHQNAEPPPAKDEKPVVDPTPPPNQEQRVKFADRTLPFALATRGRVVFVEYAGNNYGGPIQVVQVDAGSDACAGGSGKEILWRLDNGRRWDAQLSVPDGKTICIESAGGAAPDGALVWLVR
jgi:hypothetical protein